MKTWNDSMQYILTKEQSLALIKNTLTSVIAALYDLNRVSQSHSIKCKFWKIKNSMFRRFVHKIIEHSSLACDSNNSESTFFFSNLYTVDRLTGNGTRFLPYEGYSIYIVYYVSQYSRTSIARTPMARLPWLIRTRFWVPTKLKKTNI